MGHGTAFLIIKQRKPGAFLRHRGAFYIIHHIVYYIIHHRMAENEGLFLDPVYTGKAFAGVIKLAREGKFRPTDNVLFLYSGGAGGLFAIDVDLD